MISKTFCIVLAALLIIGSADIVDTRAYAARGDAAKSADRKESRSVES
jgi:hypothetical protein